MAEEARVAQHGKHLPKGHRVINRHWQLDMPKMPRTLKASLPTSPTPSIFVNRPECRVVQPAPDRVAESIEDLWHAEELDGEGSNLFRSLQAKGEAFGEAVGGVTHVHRGKV